jgi:REP element-mobilizing transposase RayT
MILNESGQIAYTEWVNLSERYPHVLFDVFQIMPNHVHGIIEIAAAAVRATLAGGG